MQVRVAAIDEAGVQHAYPKQVGWQVCDSDRLGLRRLADELNDWADVILVQHEYGIFGGTAGIAILNFMDETSTPMVAMLHTVLTRPVSAVRRVTEVMCEKSEVILVPGPRSEAILRRFYRADSTRVVQIPHGISEVVTTTSVGDPSVLLSFGYLGPNKGIENVLIAMPELVRKRPQLRYRFVGSQHPNEARSFGDAYMRRLEQLAMELGVTGRVEFDCRYVSDSDLSQALTEASLCVFPYTNPEQAVSGTLARAFGAGRAVVATAFRHAQEAAEHGAVHLVPFDDPKAIAEAVDLVLTDRRYRQRLEGRARALASGLRWPVVARRYENVLREAVGARA